MSEKQQEEELVKVLVRAGMSEDDARGEANKLIDDMGATWTLSGECPMGGWNPMACMFCPYGHMTDCHHPQTCEEANCSHYQAELAAEGYDVLNTWEDIEQDIKKEKTHNAKN